MNKTVNQKAWFFVAPVLILVAFNAIVPLMTVGYSFLTVLPAFESVGGEIQGASLDHALWFHRPFRADEWLLFAKESPSAAGARGYLDKKHLSTHLLDAMRLVLDGEIYVSEEVRARR